MQIAAQYNVKGASGLITKAVDVAQSYREYGIKAGVPENGLSGLKMK